MNRKMSSLCVTTLLSAALLAACNSSPADPEAETGSAAQAVNIVNGGTYSLHLEHTVSYTPLAAGADADNGRALFGVAADLETEDNSQALFTGFSFAAQRVITSNGRTCFTCHRGQSAQFGFPPGQLSASIPLTDPLFTGIDADAHGDPDAMHNLDQLALIKYRPGRFNLTRPETDPFRRVFFWRKSVKLLNVGLSHGFLNDARGRVMFETARGAIFSHTQDTDDRFDDLFLLSSGKGNDMEAFLFSQFTDPRLAALRDPQHPLHQTLIDDPFYTVDISTQEQERGKQVFKNNCMSCHNTPNVFNNVSHVPELGNGEPLADSPPFAPTVAMTFNVGVAERNAHGLRFTEDLGNNQFAPIVLPLVKADGTVIQHTVTFDVGLAATSARYEDLGRFKVPQLRNLVNNAPYFHDNSASTIEEVVDYFNSDLYNNSTDGHLYPIHMSAQQRADLIAFLQIL